MTRVEKIEWLIARDIEAIMAPGGTWILEEMLSYGTASYYSMPTEALNARIKFYKKLEAEVA
jgi:hypothetical protein